MGAPRPLRLSQSSRRHMFWRWIATPPGVLQRQNVQLVVGSGG